MFHKGKLEASNSFVVPTWNFSRILILGDVSITWKLSHILHDKHWECSWWGMVQFDAIFHLAKTFCITRNSLAQCMTFMKIVAAWWQYPAVLEFPWALATRFTEVNRGRSGWGILAEVDWSNWKLFWDRGPMMHPFNSVIQSKMPLFSAAETKAWG